LNHPLSGELTFSEITQLYPEKNLFVSPFLLGRAKIGSISFAPKKNEAFSFFKSYPLKNFLGAIIEFYPDIQPHLKKDLLPE